MTSFTEDMQRRGMVPGEPDARPARDACRRAPRAAPPRLSLRARRDHQPAPARRSRDDGDRDAARPGIARSRASPPADLEHQSFYELLQGRFGIEIVGGLQTIEPTVTNEEESDALGVPLHSPAFLFERTTRAANGEIVEFVRSIYRGDRYRLVTELNRGPASRSRATVRRSS